MILENTGYKKIDEVLQMHANNKPFSIYETHKGTHVLYHDIVGNLGVRGVTRTLYYPKNGNSESIIHSLMTLSNVPHKAIKAVFSHLKDEI